MTSRPRAVAGVRALALCWALGAAMPARAQDPAPAVEITVVGTAADLERVRGLVPRPPAGGARWLRVDRLEPADVLRGRRDGEAAPVRAWVDVTNPLRARLTFATGERFLVRDLDLSGRFDEVDRTALTEVIESSIAALLADERAGLTRTEAEAALARRASAAPAPGAIAPPVPPPSSSPSSPSLPPSSSPSPPPSRLAVGLFYAAQGLSGAPLVDHGPGIDLSFAAWRRFAGVHEAGRGPAVFASAQYRFPVHEHAPQIGVALTTVAARAGVECGPLFWWRLRVRLGGGLDLIHITPESSLPAAALTPARWSASVVAHAALRANLWHAPGRFWISMMPSVDVMPTAVRYDVVVDGATTSVFSPWRVRPGLTLQLTFF